MRITLTRAGKYREATFFLLCNFPSPPRASFNQNLRQSHGATESGNLVCRISALDSLDLGRLRLRPKQMKTGPQSFSLQTFLIFFITAEVNDLIGESAHRQLLTLDLEYQELSFFQDSRVMGGTYLTSTLLAFSKVKFNLWWKEKETDILVFYC